MFWKISVNAAEIAEKMGAALEIVDKELKQRVKQLAASTHAFIAHKANTELNGYMHDAYLGPNGDYLKWEEVADGIWVVSLDAKADWLESQGRPPTSMATPEWLLKPGKVKRAKDGCVLNPRNKVLTSLGWKKIKDIVAGDMVLTHSGKFREVKKLLITPAGIGTEYINFYIRSADRSKSNGNKNDMHTASISLTPDHLVLTPNGWTPAGELSPGSLIATPADLRRKCKMCSSPLPINAPEVEFCLNNKCSRSYLVKIEKRAIWTDCKKTRISRSRKAAVAAKKSGCFDRPDWGTRDPKVLYKLRIASAQAMRNKASNGKWMPEVFLEKCLNTNNVPFVRERPITTDRMVNNGRGGLRKSIVYFDFYFPEINLAIELDGKHWHSMPGAQERDEAKNMAAKRDGIKLLRIPSNKIYEIGVDLSDKIKLWHKNHSDEIGIAWVRVGKIKRGTVNRKDHVYSKKYDICLEAEEHSFCCQTVFIHNSTYRSIPISRNPKTKIADLQGSEKTLQHMIHAEMKSQGISIDRPTMGKNGKPLLGVVAKLDIQDPGHQFGGLHSSPRTPEQAALSGLQVHGGIFKLQNAIVTQRMVKKGKREVVKKEVVVFRTVSSKHNAEGRWMYPEVKPVKFFEQAHQYATKELDIIIKDIHERLGGL